MTPPSDNQPVTDALANWIVQVRWALEACHEHVGLLQLKAVIDAESQLLVALESATGGRRPMSGQLIKPHTYLAEVKEVVRELERDMNYLVGFIQSEFKDTDNQRLKEILMKYGAESGDEVCS